VTERDVSKLSRRELLKISAKTGVVLLACSFLGEACIESESSGKKRVKIIISPDEFLDKKDFFEIKSSDLPKKEKVPVQLPWELKRRLLDAVEPINSLFPSNGGNLHAFKFEVYPIQDPKIETKIGGRPDPQDESTIEIWVKPDRMIPTREAELVAFHEGVHIFLEQRVGTIFGWEQKSLYFYWDFLKKDRDRVLNELILDLKKNGANEKEVIDFIEDDNELEKHLNQLFNIVDESSYGGTGGHPYSNPGELFVSTATIMRFFPKSFMASVDNLSSANKRFFKSLGRFVIEFLGDYAASRSSVIEMFQPSLQRYLFSK